MKGRPVDQLVYEYMFPRPKAGDPQNFHAVLTRHLIYEVRQEVHSFYGHLDTQEAKYPGLDYCHPIHRIRLSRWQWHRRLFRAFDGLRLTPSEIAGLTKWEGTRWAKERFEKEQGIVIHDTSADDVPLWVEPEDRPTPPPRAPSERELSRDAEADETMDGDESEGELQSVGVPLNQRLQARVAAHNAGDTSEPLDEDWEQWLKNALETGEFHLVADQMARLSTQAADLTPEDILPARIVDAARDGRWDDVPDFLTDMLRQSLDGERHQPPPPPPPPQPQRRAAALTAAPASSSSRLVPPAGPSPASYFQSPRWRRIYSDLRLPVAEAATASASDIRVQPAAQAPGA